MEFDDLCMIPKHARAMLCYMQCWTSLFFYNVLNCSSGGVFSLLKSPFNENPGELVELRT